MCPFSNNIVYVYAMSAYFRITLYLFISVVVVSGSFKKIMVNVPITIFFAMEDWDKIICSQRNIHYRHAFAHHFFIHTRSISDILQICYCLYQHLFFKLNESTNDSSHRNLTT